MDSVEHANADFVVGDRVKYTSESEFSGTVLQVITCVRYEYEVEWDDDDPTDVYPPEALNK